MNEKIIEFQAHEFILKDKTLHPEPAKFHIPEWYKNVPNPEPQDELTIKACKPFLDSLLAGYILKNPVEQKIHFNVPGPDGKLNTRVEVSQELVQSGFKGIVGFNTGEEVHSIGQVGGMSCPYAKQNKGFAIYKIINPWTVIVPKGYSVLYTTPLNRPENRFEILSGIVDGPNILPTNFPCVFKKEGIWTLNKGDPVAAVIPFKTENWKMKISEKTIKEHSFRLFNLASLVRRWYEKTVWNKKRWI